VAPMLARTRPIPVGGDWAFEVKFDGMSLQARRDGRAVCLRSLYAASMTSSLGTTEPEPGLTENDPGPRYARFMDWPPLRGGHAVRRHASCGA
jgi:hypothetical protein